MSGPEPDNSKKPRSQVRIYMRNRAYERGRRNENLPRPPKSECATAEIALIFCAFILNRDSSSTRQRTHLPTLRVLTMAASRRIRDMPGQVVLGGFHAFRETRDGERFVQQRANNLPTSLLIAPLPECESGIPYPPGRTGTHCRGGIELILKVRGISRRNAWFG